MSESLILVVDDDAILRETVAEYLALEGHAVATARDGAAALSRIAADPPALLVLDMHMPVLDGPGLAAALAARGWRLPIVVVSSSGGAACWAAEIGARAYLPKPFETGDLVRVVSDALEETRALAAIA